MCYILFPNKVTNKLLLLLLSRFSHVRLCATPQTAAHRAPPSLGFSSQEHWSGHLGCFHVLAIINSAAINIWVHVSLSILVSSVCMPSSGIAGS